MYRMTFITNPKSGGGLGLKIHQSLYQALITMGVRDEEMQLYTTQRRGNKKKIQALLEQSEQICIIGGDGTISKVLKNYIFVNRHPPLTLVPLGTGNDLAHVMGTKKFFIQKGTSGIADLLLHGKTKPLDIWQVNGGKVILCNYLSFGFDAAAMAYLNMKRKHGAIKKSSPLRNKANVFIGGLKSLFKTINEGNVVLYDQEKKVTHQLGTAGKRCIIFSNIPSYGGGAPLVPDAKPDDGQLYLTCITSIMQLTQLFTAQFLGFDKLQPKLPYIACNGADITLSPNEAFQVDGENKVKLIKDGFISIRYYGQIKVKYF